MIVHLHGLQGRIVPMLAEEKLSWHSSTSQDGLAYSCVGHTQEDIQEMYEQVTAAQVQTEPHGDALLSHVQPIPLAIQTAPICLLVCS